MCVAAKATRSCPLWVKSRQIALLGLCPLYPQKRTCPSGRDRHNPGSFIDTPTAKPVRQVLGAISEFDKAMTVAKLRGARERKRRDAGKCEGRKSHAECNPEVVALVRQLRRRRPKGGQRSLREISAELAQRGIMNERGNAFSASSINSMLR